MLEEQQKKRLQKMLAQQAVVEAPVFIETEPEVIPEDRAPVFAPVTPPVEVEEVVVEQPAQEEVEVAEKLLCWGENGRPLWAQNNFEVLLFDVAGLSLAVPLVALGQIVPINKKLTFLHGQSEWFMGILPSPIGDVRTVNTALFVMPERHNPSFAEKAKYVVTIDGLPWGLAVDSVNQPISLSPDDVSWRTERSKRPWLAGTVKAHMCALIDIPQMAEMLKASNKDR